MLARVSKCQIRGRLKPHRFPLAELETGPITNVSTVYFQLFQGPKVCDSACAGLLCWQIDFSSIVSQVGWIGMSTVASQLSDLEWVPLSPRMLVIVQWIFGMSSIFSQFAYSEWVHHGPRVWKSNNTSNRVYLLNGDDTENISMCETQIGLSDRF